jgi:hypothetical protein
MSGNQRPGRAPASTPASAALALIIPALLALAACGPSGSRDITPFVQDPAGRTDGGADGKADLSAPASDTPIAPPGDLPPDGGAPAGDDAGTDVPMVPADAGGMDLPPKRNAGDPCGSAQDCASGFCVDNVCCATACTDRCFVCNRAGAVGTCAAVPPGEDPRNECMLDAVTTCGRDGTCDGKGGCRLFPANTECEPGGCFGTTAEKSASLCDGKGVCQSPTTRNCTAATCQNGSCGTACTSSAVCLPGFHCDANVCRLKRGLGDACSSAGQCASNNCVSGICCDSACDKACFSCKQASKPGTCLPVPAGEDPGDKCSAEDASTCRRDGLCDGNGACRFWAQGTACGAASCMDAVVSSARACDGKGTCSAATRTDCGAYACGEAATCGTTCTGSAGCAPGFICSGTTCVQLALALRWAFEETSGTMAADASGNGRVGTGTATPSTEVPSTPSFSNLGSRAFAKGQVMQITPMPDVFKTLTALTLSVFYKSGPPPSGGDGSELISLADNHLLRLTKAGGFEVTKRTADMKRHKCTVSIPTAIDNKWHHVATTIETTGIKLYFDGVLQTCNLTVGNTATNPLPVIALGGDVAGNFTAGRHGTTSPNTNYDFVGNIDEVRVYWRALSASEIAALALGGP